MKIKQGSVLTLVAASLFLGGTAYAQFDPGVQGGTPRAGKPLDSVSKNLPAGIFDFFTDGKTRFIQVEDVTTNGLGPRFNSNSCSSCHSQPDIGGTGAAVNPQASFVSNGTAPRDTTPSFSTPTVPPVKRASHSSSIQTALSTSVRRTAG